MDAHESPPATTRGLPSRGCGCSIGGRRLAQLLFLAREQEGAGLGTTLIQGGSPSYSVHIHLQEANH